MNIFILSKDHRLCAQYHTDAHVNKLILEAAQMLISALRVDHGVSGVLTKRNKQTVKYNHVLTALEEEKLGQQTYYTSPSLASNPCCKWARKTQGNFTWLYAHMCHLQEELIFRNNWVNGRQHASVLEVDRLLHLGLLPKSKDTCRTPFVQAMPDRYKCANPVKAYRSYYLAEKVLGATWTKRDVPWWVLSP